LNAWGCTKTEALRAGMGLIGHECAASLRKVASMTSMYCSGFGALDHSLVTKVGVRHNLSTGLKWISKLIERI
jgi:hypothetical protein